jgi:glycerate 2-kinase
VSSTEPAAHVVAAPDKLRGTLTALQAAAAIAAGATRHGIATQIVPLADGGEGTLDALAASGGQLRTATVTGPLGQAVAATYLLRYKTAYIEMAQASGLALVGGAAGNNPLEASTAGTGELVRAAIGAGATKIVVTLGGSATTDGGLGFLQAMAPLARWKGITFVAATDVVTTFADAADVFAPQKGASPAQVRLLRGRLERLAGEYARERGIDVSDMAGSGAAGGLAGALASLGAKIVSGFDLVADAVDLPDHLTGARAIVTAEGFIDDGSFEGKVVGGVCRMAAAAGVPVLAIGGQVLDGLDGAGVVSRLTGGNVTVVSLSDRFGSDRALAEPAALITEVVAGFLGGWHSPSAIANVPSAPV